MTRLLQRHRLPEPDAQGHRRDGVSGVPVAHKKGCHGRDPGGVTILRLALPRRVCVGGAAEDCVGEQHVEAIEIGAHGRVLGEHDQLAAALGLHDHERLEGELPLSFPPRDSLTSRVQLGPGEADDVDASSRLTGVKMSAPDISTLSDGFQAGGEPVIGIGRRLHQRAGGGVWRFFQRRFGGGERLARRKLDARRGRLCLSVCRLCPSGRRSRAGLRTSRPWGRRRSARPRRSR